MFAKAHEGQYRATVTVHPYLLYCQSEGASHPGLPMGRAGGSVGLVNKLLELFEREKQCSPLNPGICSGMTRMSRDGIWRERKKQTLELNMDPMKKGMYKFISPDSIADYRHEEGRD